MIQRLARLLGFTAFGLWLSRQPRRVAVVAQLAIVLLAFGIPVALAALGRLNYAEVWWWLWVDALIVGVWTIVALRGQPSAGFFAIHYLGMFTLLPGLLVALLLSRTLPMETRWWVIAIVGVVSFVVQGWLSRRYWLRPDTLGAGRPGAGAMVLPYLRLAVVYAGMFIPLSIAGVPQGDDRPISLDDTIRATVILTAIKLLLEVILALIDLIRTLRPKR